MAGSPLSNAIARERNTEPGELKMKLTEYTKIVEQAERDLPTADRQSKYGIHIAITGVQIDIDNALWQPGYRGEARLISARCTAILRETYQSL